MRGMKVAIFAENMEWNWLYSLCTQNKTAYALNTYLGTNGLIRDQQNQTDHDAGMPMPD